MGKTKAKAKATATTKQLCIRCPDPVAADNLDHQNDLAKCVKHNSTAPIRIKDKQGNDTDKFKDAKLNASALWWGFLDGPNTLDLSDTNVCKELLEVAKKAGSQHAFEVNMTDPEEQAWLKKVGEAKQDAKFQNSQITKGMLEEAVMKVHAPKTDAEKKAEKEKKKAEKEQEKAAPKSGSVQNAVDDSAERSEKEFSADKVKTLAAGQSGEMSYRPKPGFNHKAAANNQTGDGNSGETGKQQSEKAGGAGDDQGSGNEGRNEPRTAVTKTAKSYTRYCPADLSHRNQKGVTQMPSQVRQPAPNNHVKDPLPHNQLQAFTAALPAIKRQHDSLMSAATRLPVSNTTAKQPLEYHELRGSIATLNANYEVLSNHFTVTIPEDKVLYEYQVIGIPAKASRPKRRVLILDMLECDQTLYDNRQSIVTDYRQKVISYVPLFTDDQVQPGADVAQVAVPNFNPGTRDEPEVQVLTLRFIARHDLNGLRDFVAGRNEGYKDSGAAEAMNIVIAKAVADGSHDTFQVGNNRFYYRPGWISLQNWNDAESAGLVSIRGYYSSIKPAMGAVLLNVNTVTGVFYQAQQLAQYLEHFYRFGGFTERERKNWDRIEPKKLLKMAQKHLSGLRVWVDFERSMPGDQDTAIDNPNRRTKTLAELGGYPEQQYFLDDNNKSVQVYEHINAKYPRAVADDDHQFLTGNVGKKQVGSHPGPAKYYCARQLKVLSDQPYREFPLPSNVTAKMIEMARRKPIENYRAILSEGVASLGLHETRLPQMLRELGIRVSKNMICLPARMIDRPNIVYQGNAKGSNVMLSVETKGNWRLDRNTQFLDTTHGFNALRQSVATVQFFRPAGPMLYEQFERQYIENWNKLHGLNGIQRTRLLNPSKPYEVITDWNEDALKRHFGLLQGKLHLAIIVFPDQSKENRERYATFKIVMDQHLGMKSICFNEKKMTSSLSNFDPAAGSMISTALVDYIRNAAMKLNLRCGNFNHTVRPQDLPKIGDSPCNTIVLGADVTHPGSGSLRGTPSIAAVVGSVDNQFGLFPASMRLNPPRQEIIADMAQMVTERLLAWEAKNGALPTSILYYRDGVGDSMYPEVRAKEITAISLAYTKLHQHRFPDKPVPDPKITAVVVTKRHHTRLYPRDMINKGPHMSPTGNCPPGTVVDSGITSPYYFDFFLQSHHSLQGQAKPAHYFVLQNGMGFSAKELQDLTNALCHTYGRSTTAVSYAPPAYYADRLCERGRLYLKPFLDGAANLKLQNLSEEDVWKKAEKVFYRGGGRSPGKGNPWHTAHDGKMFWM